MAPKCAEKMVVHVLMVGSSKRLTRGNKEVNTLGQECVRIIPLQEDASTSTITTEDKAAQEEQKKGSASEAQTQEGHDDGKEKKKRKRKRRRGEGYQRHIYRVLKQVHPEMGISSEAMTVLNNLMNDMFERLADEAAKLKAYTGHMTLTSREIQGAVKLVLPGELGKHAIAEAVKAVNTYISNDT